MVTLQINLSEDFDNDGYFEYRISRKIQLIKGLINRIQKEINEIYSFSIKKNNDIFYNLHKASNILDYSDLCDFYVLKKVRCILKEYVNLLAKYKDDKEMLVKIDEEFKKSNVILTFDPDITSVEAKFVYNKGNKTTELTCTVLGIKCI